MQKYINIRKHGSIAVKYIYIYTIYNKYVYYFPISFLSVSWSFPFFKLAFKKKIHVIRSNLSSLRICKTFCSFLMFYSVYLKKLETKKQVLVYITQCYIIRNQYYIVWNLVICLWIVLIIIDSLFTF